MIRFGKILQEKFRNNFSKEIQKARIYENKINEGNKKTNFYIKISFAKALAYVKAYTLTFTKATIKRLSANIGKDVSLQIKEKIEPVTRTGELAASIKYVQLSDGVEIYSDDPAASALLPPSEPPIPPISKLITWMGTKSEFAGMDEKTQRRTAFAIQSSIRNKVGVNSSGQSDVQRLSPTGTRMFDFVGEAVDDLIKAVDDSIDIMGNI